jgi:hypothetical protein
MPSAQTIKAMINPFRRSGYDIYIYVCVCVCVCVRARTAGMNSNKIGNLYMYTKTM